MYLVDIDNVICFKQDAADPSRLEGGAVEYTDCISGEE